MPKSTQLANGRVEIQPRLSALHGAWHIAGSLIHSTDTDRCFSQAEWELSIHEPKESKPPCHMGVLAMIPIFPMRRLIWEGGAKITWL